MSITFSCVLSVDISFKLVLFVIPQLLRIYDNKKYILLELNKKF